MSLISRLLPAFVAAVVPGVLAHAPLQGHGQSRVHEIRMEVSNGAYRFAPATLNVPRGDTVVFVVASGEPHDVAFDTTSLSAAAKQHLRPKIQEPIAPFAGALLVNRGAKFVLDTSDLPPGTYPFYCLPHLALEMKGVLRVQ